MTNNFTCGVSKFIRSISFLITILFLLSSFGLMGQTVTGVVTAEDDGLGIPGANVLVKGTTQGTVTDLDGNFSIQVQNLDVTLVFSYVGYVAQERPLEGQYTRLDVVLQRSFEELDEVIVIGYGTQKKSDLTGSVVKVSTEDIQEIPIVNVGDALKGRAAGVYVNTNTGHPGKAPTILIRGASSLNATNTPLVIIDGAPGGDLGSLNFNDIESYEILKDAAASAIYGSRGANGVILVTTKRGQSGKNKIDFSVKYGTRHFPKSHDLLNSQQYYDYLKDVLTITDPPFSTEYYANYEAVGQGTIDTTNFYELNWQDEMFDLGTFQEYNLAFSGGMENLSYLVSGSYLKDVGIIKPAEYDRYTFRANINSKLNKRISIVSDAYLTHTYRSNVNDAGLGWNQGVVNACLQYPPFLPIYDERTGNFFPNPIRPNVDSPYALANGIWNDRYNTNINGNFRLNIDIISGLRFRSEWFGRLSFGDSRSFSDRINTYIGRDKNGTGSDSKSNSLGTTIQNILEFSKTIGRHDLYAMAGHIAEHSWSHSLSTFGYDYPTDYLILVRNATQFEPPNDGIGEGRHYAVISRINYSYNNKYLVQVNFRADGSDNFAGGNKWGYFPSASFGWKISEESFMADFVNIDLLKVRFGLGQTGNDAIGFAYLSTYGSGSRSKYPIFGDDNPIAYYTRGLANPNLKWEETFETNLAIDFASFRGRLNLSLELYSRNSYDLLYSKPVPITTGSRTVQANLGKVNNKGIEFMATTHNISNRNFSWKTDFNISYNHNEVISLGEEYEAVTSGYRWVYPGYPIDAFFAYRVDRILQEDDFESGDLIEGIPIQIGAGPGDIKFKDFKNTEDIDLDGTPDIAITDEDRVYIGNPLPSITYGVTNSLSFKGLTLNVFFQGISGNKIYNSTRVTSEGMNDYFNQFATILDRWTPTNTDTDMPRAVSGDPNKNTRESDRWIENGWFFRVKDITLSYSLPSSITSRVGILRTTFYVTGQNWITLTDYSGYDPEVGSEDNGAYPQVKSLIFGINLSF